MDKVSANVAVLLEVSDGCCSVLGCRKDLRSDRVSGVSCICREALDHGARTGSPLLVETADGNPDGGRVIAPFERAVGADDGGAFSSIPRTLATQL